MNNDVCPTVYYADIAWSKDKLTELLSHKLINLELQNYKTDIVEVKYCDAHNEKLIWDLGLIHLTVGWHIP